MKTGPRGALTGAAFCVLASVAPAPCFAGAVDTAEPVETLRKAAEELRATDPALAEKLDKMADKKSKKLV